MNLRKDDWTLTKWLPEDQKGGMPLCRLNCRDQIVTNDGVNPVEYDFLLLDGDNAWVIGRMSQNLAHKVPKSELYYFEHKKTEDKPNTVDFRKIRFNDLFIRPRGTRIVCTVLTRGEKLLLYASSAGELREVFSRDIHNFELAFNCQGPWMNFETMKNNPHFYA